MVKEFKEVQQNEEADDYLIELMGLKDDFPDEAMSAYGKIYGRYWDVMFAVARNVTKDEDVAADLLSDTFAVIYNKASTFRKSKISNPDNVRFSIQKWMAVIMQNVYYDHFLDEAYKTSSNDEDFEESYIIEKKFIGNHITKDYYDFTEQLSEIEKNGSDEEENSEDSANLTKVRDYMEKLSERDKDIILTIYNYHVPGKYTPAHVLDGLIEKWVTTRENIRKILEKFRKAIKDELQPTMFIRK